MATRPDITDIYQDHAGEWRWRRKAPNGEVIADSAEGYTRKADCEKAAKRVFGVVDEQQAADAAVPESGLSRPGLASDPAKPKSSY